MACKTEVYSRITGFYSNLNQWNSGKREEFADRSKFNIDSKQAQNDLIQTYQGTKEVST